MNQEEDYASDSDQSDEDFCPENEIAVPESDEDVTSGGEDEVQESPEQKRKGGNKKLKQKITKRTKNHDADEDENDKEISEQNYKKRCTRQTEADAEKSNKAKHEKNELESDDDEKSRTDALWADFLSDVKHVPKKTCTTTSSSASTKTSAIKEHLPKIETEVASTNGKQQAPSNSQVETVHAVSKLKSSETETPKKIVVTEIVDFAGEEVRVQKTINADSIKENKASIAQKGATANGSCNKRGLPGMLKRPSALAASGSSSGGGLGFLLNQLDKKKKISVLEKSQLDWNSFKQDEGIDEELQTFNKGKDGYLERQDFLQRTDLRQFEIEKQLRQTKRNQ